LICVTPVELKVRAGYCSASKKSADLRWPSRSATPVLMEAISALKLNCAVEKSSPAVVAWASRLFEEPQKAYF